MTHKRKFSITIGSTIIICIFSVLFFFNSGCEMGGGGTPVTEFGIIGGVVMDTDGTSVEGVTVTIGNKSAQTDAQGTFEVRNVPASSKVIVKFRKSNYCLMLQEANLPPNGNIYMSPRLMAIGTKQTIDPTISNTVTDGDGSVTINPNSLNVSGANPVTVEFTAFDPTVTGEFYAFPGDFAGKLTTDGTEFAFETFGYVNITVKQGTNTLQLNSGATAEVHIPVPASLRSRAFSECPTIDLWRYDETAGQWINQGVATLEELGHTYYKGIINHLSYWNCDQIISTGYVYGYVINPAGNVVHGAFIWMTPIGWYGSAPYWDTYTNASGSFEGLPVKSGQSSKFYAKKGKFVSTPEEMVGPVAGNSGKLPEPLVVVNSLDDVYAVAMAPSPGIVANGRTMTLHGYAINIIGQITTANTIEWGSSNPGVATVEASGFNVSVSGVSLGTCAIIATCEGVTSSTMVTVVPDVWMKIGGAVSTGSQSLGQAIVVKNGIIYVAYGTTSFNGIMVATCEVGSNTWVPMGSSGTGGMAVVPSLFVYNGTPYVSFVDLDNGQRITVMSFEASSGNWLVVGERGFSADQASANSLFVYNGIPYVAYTDAAYSSRMTVMSYEADSDTWEAIGGPGFAPVSGMAEYPSLCVDNGTPYLAFRDSSIGGGETVMSFEAASATWINVGTPGFTGSAAYYGKMTIYDHVPYIAYTDVGNGSKASVMKYNAGSNTWALVGNEGFSSGIAAETVIAVDNGIPYVAFRDWDYNDYPVNYPDYSFYSKATVMSFEAGSDTWKLLGAPGFSDGQGANWIEMGVYNNTPYVVYRDFYTNPANLTVMKYEP